MTTVQMKYFIEIAKCLSFSVAADRLYISQPALSRHIASMENELNVQLFIRSKNTVRLTPAGQELLSRLDKLYTEYCAVVRDVQMVNTGATGRLNIGILEYQYLPEPIIAVMQQLACSHPEIEINLSAGSYTALKSNYFITNLMSSLRSLWMLEKSRSLLFFHLNKASFTWSRPPHTRTLIFPKYPSKRSADTFLMNAFYPCLHKIPMQPRRL